METLKAGCFLVNKEDMTVAIIFRKKQQDYSFPKGHVEPGEDIKLAALRETAEETKHDGRIVTEFEPYIERYITSKGEKCVCYMFVAIDIGQTSNTSLDTHDTFWIPLEEVDDKLSYDSLKETWRNVKQNIQKFLLF